MTAHKLTRIFEVSGSALAIFYAVAIASNTGREVLAFILLLVSASLFAAWAVIDRRWAFLLLQGFYIASAFLGLAHSRAGGESALEGALQRNYKLRW